MHEYVAVCDDQIIMHVCVCVYIYIYIFVCLGRIGPGPRLKDCMGLCNSVQ